MKTRKDVSFHSWQQRRLPFSAAFLLRNKFINMTITTAPVSRVCPASSHLHFFCFSPSPGPGVQRSPEESLPQCHHALGHAPTGRLQLALAGQGPAREERAGVQVLLWVFDQLFTATRRVLSGDYTLKAPRSSSRPQRQPPHKPFTACLFGGDCRGARVQFGMRTAYLLQPDCCCFQTSLC